MKLRVAFVILSVTLQSPLRLLFQNTLKESTIDIYRVRHSGSWSEVEKGTNKHTQKKKKKKKNGRFSETCTTDEDNGSTQGLQILLVQCHTQSELFSQCQTLDHHD